MKDKFLIRIHVPLADFQCDTLLPMDAPVEAVLFSLTALIKAKLSAELPLLSSPVLWSIKEGKALNTKLSLHEQGIMDSDMLYLI